MGQALYRLYRSKNLGEIVGQEHITTTLAHALKNGTISHAYLFTGPRGVGKTSVARILAHEVNGLPYTDDSMHLDIIEIDAASNRRIEEIRNLRDKVHITPTSAKYKVYIIDEVHMLTREAFNALLKTLEEPPAHVIFILATTEAHKLPETIISRTQRYSFRPVPFDKVVAHLREIADKEKLEVSEDALELLAEYGEGSFRDSISLLDQARNQVEAVTRESVQAMLGVAPSEAINNLLQAIGNHDGSAVVQILDQLMQQGFEAASIAKQLSSNLRQQLINSETTLPQNTVMSLLRSLLDIPTSSDSKSLLEIVLLTSIYTATETAVLSQPLPVNPKTDVKSPKKSVKQERPVLEVSFNDQTSEKNSKTSPTTAVVVPEENNVWPQILEAIKRKHNTLYSVLRMASPHFNKNELVLSFAFIFHQKRLNEPKNRQIVADTVTEITGSKLSIRCIVNENEQPPKTLSSPLFPKKSPVKNREGTDSAIDNISNIFGSAELLES